MNPKNIFKLAVLILVAVILTCLPVSAAGVQKEKNPNEFASSNQSYWSNIYFRYPEKKICKDMSERNEYGNLDTNNAIIKAIDALPELRISENASEEKAEFSLVAVHDITKKKNYFELRPNELRYNKNSYQLTTKQYQELKRVSTEREATGRAFPQWLTETNLERIDTALCKKGDKTWSLGNFNSPYGLMHLVRSVLTHIEVLPDSYKAYSGTAVGLFKDAFEMRTVFDTNGYFDIVINGDKFYIERSDKNYGCEYVLQDPEYVLKNLLDVTLPPYYNPGLMIPLEMLEEDDDE